MTTDGNSLHALEPAKIEHIIAVANGAQPKLTKLMEGVVERALP